MLQYVAAMRCSQGMVGILLDQQDGHSVVAIEFTDDLENVPEQFRYVGAEVPMQNSEGETKTFYVSKIEDGKLTVDGNHPLAGKTLTLRVKILDVRDSTEEDIRQSGIHSTNPQSLN